jgi:spore coat protein CotH
MRTPLSEQHLNRRAFLAGAASSLAALACATSGAEETEAQQQERADFFRQGIIPRCEIEIAPKDLESLRKEPRKYVPATFKEGAKVLRQVGVHVKGAAGSFRGIDDKAALTINTNKFVSDQYYRGLDKFHLNNSVQDATYLNELLCAELMHAAGVPVSFCSHATVTFNGRNRGFFVLKEGYDKGFLRRYFKDIKGHLYDGGFLQDIDGNLQQLLGKEEGNERKELKAVAQACNLSNHKQRLQRLEKLLDLDKFLTLIALEVITWHWDGYAMKRNNYRVYHEPTLDKIYIIPHGMDQMFGDPGGPIQPNFEGLVARALIQTGEGKQRYRERFIELLRQRFHPDELSQRIDSLEPKLLAVLASVDKSAARDYPAHLRNLRSAIKQRHEEMLKQVKRNWRMEV